MLKECEIHPLLKADKPIENEICQKKMFAWNTQEMRRSIVGNFFALRCSLVERSFSAIIRSIFICLLLTIEFVKSKFSRKQFGAKIIQTFCYTIATQRPKVWTVPCELRWFSHSLTWWFMLIVAVTVACPMQKYSPTNVKTVSQVLWPEHGHKPATRCVRKQ